MASLTLMIDKDILAVLDGCFKTNYR